MLIKNILIKLGWIVSPEETSIPYYYCPKCSNNIKSIK